MSRNSEKICFKCLSDIILKSATYFGLRYDNAEDCRITFVEKMMRPDGCALGACKDACKDACKHRLVTYALNHLIDHMRPIWSRSKIETSLEEYIAKNGENAPIASPAQSIDPQEELSRNDFLEHMNVALEVLTKNEIDVLVRHGYFDQSLGEIADELDIKKEALDQTLRRARRRLLKILRDQGYIE